MKKIISALCITLALIISLFSFSSCQQPDKSDESGSLSDDSVNDNHDNKTQEELLLEMNELDRADELSRLSDIAMSEKLSYKTTMIGEIQTILQGDVVVGEIKGESAYLFGNTGDFVYQEKIESTTKYKDEESVATLIEGYQNGYMYIYNKSNGSTTTFKSPITKDQYLQHMKDMGVETDFELDREGCKEITAQRNEDGTWTVTYAKFTEERLELLLSELQNLDEQFDESYLITDVKIDINIMSDFTIKNATMDFEFTKNKDINDSATPLSATEDTEGKNKLYIEILYDYNTLTVMEEIDLSSIKYKEIEDLRYFYIIQKKLDELKNSEEAKVVIDVKSDVDYRGMVSIIEETDNIIFKNKDGNLEYEIDSVSNSGRYKILYANGYQDLIDESGTIQHEEVSEMEARAYLESMLDVAGYKIDIIRNIEKVSDGEYIFTLKPSNSSYKDIVDAYGGYVEESSSTLTIKLLNGKIVYYHYTFYADVYLSTVSSYMELDQSVICTYEY